MIVVERCPRCGKDFHLNLGDLEDFTLPDVEATICPYCEHKYLLEGAEEFTTLEEAYDKKGESICKRG